MSTRNGCHWQGHELVIVGELGLVTMCTAGGTGTGTLLQRV